MKRAVPILAMLFAAFSTAACDGGDRSVTASSPSIHLPAVAGRPGVGYFEIQVHTEQGALVSVTAPRIGRIEMHESMASSGMTSMRPLQRIPIGEEGRIAFIPGGRHLMLFNIDPALRPGDQVTLSFNFERGPPRTVTASVRAAGDERH